MTRSTKKPEAYIHIVLENDEDLHWEYNCSDDVAVALLQATAKHLQELEQPKNEGKEG